MKEIKVGIVGLGRLGSVHAQNLAFKIPGCKLVAACSLEQKELDWAKDYLKVEYTTTDYKKMVDEADIEAVVIVSLSPEHCWMIEYALDAGKHVFTDKPLRRHRSTQATSASRISSRRPVLTRRLWSRAASSSPRPRAASSSTLRLTTST